MTDTALITSNKRERTKLANRQAILDAGREVFGELGYEATTVRDIIRRTSLAAGTFYNYYRSKDDVFDALAEDATRRFRPILRAQYNQAVDFESYLRGAVTAFLKFIAQEQVMHPLDSGADLQRQTPELTAIYREVREALDNVLERDQGPKVDIDYLAGACIALTREIGRKMLDRHPVDTEAAATFTVSLILGGIAALPHREG